MSLTDISLMSGGTLVILPPSLLEHTLPFLTILLQNSIT